ncbi:uncharacterized protein LOC144805192 [Lissotriton helveticus]
MAPLEDVVAPFEFKIVSYADDTQLVVSLSHLDQHPDSLLRCLQQIHHWMCESSLKLNGSKTEVMLMGKKWTSIPPSVWPNTLGMSDLGSILVKECTTCNESKTHILQIDDERTVFMDGKKEFKRIGNRLYNQKYNTEKKRFPCTYCGKSFTQKSCLLRHQKTHTGEKTLSCTECQKSFTHLSILRLHYRSHTGEKPFTCNECGKTFTQQGGLKHHLKIHRGEVAKCFPCSECGKCFVYKSDFLRHQKIHIRKSFVFKSEDQQAQRVRNDWKPFPCTECGKGFTSRTGLKRHLKIHKGEVEKPFLCSECGRSFVYKSELERHQRIHTGEKPFDCTVCGKSFSFSF